MLLIYVIFKFWQWIHITFSIMQNQKKKKKGDSVESE